MALNIAQADIKGQLTLLSLPAELRNHLYWFICPPQQIDFHTEGLGSSSSNCFFARKDCSGQFLKVCKQIRFEAMSIFLDNLTFNVRRHVQVRKLPCKSMVKNLVINTTVSHIPQLKLFPIKYGFTVLDSLVVKCIAKGFETAAGHEQKYNLAWQEVRDSAIKILVDGHLNVLEDKSTQGREVHFWLRRVEDTSRERPGVSDPYSIVCGFILISVKVQMKLVRLQLKQDESIGGVYGENDKCDRHGRVQE